MAEKLFPSPVPCHFLCTDRQRPESAPSARIVVLCITAPGLEELQARLEREDVNHKFSKL